MRVPLSWLREFVDLPPSVEELARRLTLAGMEVVDIHYIGVEGSALPWDAALIVTANILEVRPHPNADRLVLAEVDYGAAAPHTVVTGAPNLFPYRGQGRLNHPLKGVFAREGARLYDGHAEGKVITTLKGRPVRGVMSDAMLCSEKELGISEEHEGIILLEDDAPVGVPLRDFMGEVVLEIDFTPNYGRALSIVGLAREVAAIIGAALRLPEPGVVMDGPPIAGRAAVTIERPDLCPRFTLGLVEGVTIGSSPGWMQRRLTNAGMRPINAIVDVSNYVMLELGQPNHMFDADMVSNGHLIVREARPGERLTTLDGRDRDLSPGRESSLSDFPLLVCDEHGPSSVAGVMGGAASEVRAETTRVLVEAAIWEPVQIRKTARALKLPSEASRRFERGVDYELPPLAQRRCLQLIQQIAGGTVAQGLVDEYPRPWQPLTLDLSPQEVARIVGISLSAEAIAALLARLGFGCALYTDDEGSFVRVMVPSFRQDVTILADLCEEVARVYGYDNVPATRLADELPRSDEHPELIVDRKVREVLIGCGASELITHTLIDMALVAKLAPAEAVASAYLRVSNPTAPERVYLRRSLLPSLLNALALNLRERERALVFELGRVYLPPAHIVHWQQGCGDARAQATPGQPDADLPAEPRRLAIALGGPRLPLGWVSASNERADTSMDFFDLKGFVATLLARLGLNERISYAPLSDDERFHPGRAAALLLERTPPTGVNTAANARQSKGSAATLSERVGVLGELHPAVRERLGLTSRIVAAELDLEALIGALQPTHFAPISRYPPTMQDLAIVVAHETPAAEVETLLRKSAGELLENLTLFDIYSGPQLGAGKRSLAYRLTFRASDRTLNDDTIAKVRAKIIKQLERQLGATIRA